MTQPALHAIITIIVFFAIVMVLLFIIAVQLRLKREIVEVKRAISLIKPLCQCSIITPSVSENDSAPGGRFFHVENYPIKYQMPDQREVEKVEK